MKMSEPEGEETVMGSYTRMLNDYNNTLVQLPINTLDGLFYDGLKGNESKIAIWSVNSSISYKELNTKSNQVAAFLLQKGIDKNTCIGVLGYREPLTVIYALGILKAGGIYVPIEPTYPPDRIAYIKTNSNIEICFDEESFSQLNLGSYNSENIQKVSIPDQLAYVIYTSGSTGKPKGVMITHKAAANTILDINTRFHISRHDNILGLSSLGFDLSIYDIFGSLSTGASLYMAQDVRDAENLYDILREKQITFWNSVPSTMDLFLANFANREIPGVVLKNVLLSGDWIPIALPGKIKDNFPGVKVTSLGGATEASIWSIYFPIESVNEEWKSIPYGYPLANQTFYVLDDDRKSSPLDAEGELYIGGAGVAEGYFNDPVKTENAFVQHPEFGRIYRTGDYGIFRKEGYIEFVGRKDFQVKIGGNRIELGEIEVNVSKLPDVKSVVCLVREDEIKTKKISCFIVPENDNGDKLFNKEEILAWRDALRQTLPDYMMPNEWIKLNEVPLTSNGKLDRSALFKLAAAIDDETRIGLAKPMDDGNENANTGQQPGRTEAIIKGIWEEELNIKDISVDADFFELGGQSMTAVHVMNKIEQRINVRLPLITLFHNPTIKDIAELIDNHRSVDVRDNLLALKNSGNKPPLYLIHGAALNTLLFKHLAMAVTPDQPLYSIQALGLDGRNPDLSSVEVIASQYLERILKHNPQGPYHLVGYSLGGVIAYEMARQLLERGVHIEKIVVFDTNVANKLQNKVSWLNKKVSRQPRKVMHFFRNFIHYPKDTANYQIYSLFRKLHLRNSREDGEDKVYDYKDAVVKAYRKAIDEYTMKPLDIKVDLIKVAKRIYFIDDPRHLGWKAFVNDGLSIYTTPGDHKTFLMPPNTTQLAALVELLFSEGDGNV